MSLRTDQRFGYWVRTRRRSVVIGWKGHLPLVLGPRDLYLAEAADPWPSLRLVLWPFDGNRQEHFLRRAQASLFGSADRLARRQEEVVREVFEWSSEQAPHAELVRGWLDAPSDVEEAIAEWPEAGQGGPAYRSVQRDALVAERRPLRPFDTLLSWLASSPDKPWRQTPRRLGLTANYLYYESFDDKRYRVPLTSLRTSSPAGQDRVYVFGRRTRVVLTAQEGCPIVERLDSLMSVAKGPLIESAPGGTERAPRVDLNTAQLHELAELPHIGRVRAGQITSLRNRRNGLRRPQEIMVIPGISTRIFAELQPQIHVRPHKPQKA